MAISKIVPSNVIFLIAGNPIIAFLPAPAVEFVLIEAEVVDAKFGEAGNCSFVIIDDDKFGTNLLVIWVMNLKVKPLVETDRIGVVG